MVQSVVPQDQSSELLEEVCQEEHVRLQVQLQVLVERGGFEGLPHIDRWA